jgi:ribonuclease P protein component
MRGTIKSYSHFKFVMNSGKKMVFSHSVVYWVPYQKFCGKFKSYIQENGVYGIMVTKKMGNAVKRNFMKRRIRVALAKMDLQNFATVIVARNSSAEVKIEDIIVDFSKIFSVK